MCSALTYSLVRSVIMFEMGSIVEFTERACSKILKPVTNEILLSESAFKMQQYKTVASGAMIIVGIFFCLILFSIYVRRTAVTFKTFIKFILQGIAGSYIKQKTKFQKFDPIAFWILKYFD